MIMRTKIILLICTLLLTSSAFAQSISGNLSLLARQQITLEGFDGLKTYPISNTSLDEKGNFKLTYSKADYGIGYTHSIAYHLQ